MLGALATMLREGPEIGLVGREDGNAQTEVGREHLRERNVAPPQVGSEVDEAV